MNTIEYCAMFLAILCLPLIHGATPVLKTNDLRMGLHIPIYTEHGKHLLNVGKTRRELEKAYCHDGGIFSPLEGERYVLMDQSLDGPEGHVLKLRVLYRPANISDEIYKDPEKFGKWMREHKGYGSDDDIVVGISALYWEPPYFD